MEMFAQPIHSLTGNRVRKYETLMRMRSAEGELIEPARFMNAALRYGLIREVDIIALRKTLACLAENADLLGTVDSVAVNMSGVSLAHPGCVATTIDAIKASGVRRQSHEAVFRDYRDIRDIQYDPGPALHRCAA